MGGKTYTIELPECDGTNDRKDDATLALINGVLQTTWAGVRDHKLSYDIVTTNLLRTLVQTMAANGRGGVAMAVTLDVLSGNTEGMIQTPMNPEKRN